MKTHIDTILAATDFSPVADNALEYAAQLALKLESRLVLLHVYNVPVTIADVSVIMPTLHELEEACTASLERKRTEMQSVYPSLKIETRCTAGFVKEEVNRCADEVHADLIVIGAQGGSYMEERFFGSTASLLMRQANYPVLAIDKSVTFQEFSSITLACDYQRVQHQHDVLNPLRLLAKAFDARILILHVTAEKEPVPTLDEAIAGLSMDHALGNTAHTFHQYTHNDVVEGIQDFSEMHQSGLIVMIPHTHNFLEQLMQGSLTRKMAFHARLPVLSLHA